MVKIPIGKLDGVFETRLLRAIQKASAVSHKVVIGMRQERDFKTLAKFTPDLVVGKNGPAYGFELVLDNQLAYISPPVWLNKDEVGPAVTSFVTYVRQLPPFDN